MATPAREKTQPCCQEKETERKNSTTHDEDGIGRMPPHRAEGQRMHRTRAGLTRIVQPISRSGFK